MSLRHAILGFLAHTPMTGYDLKRHMAQSVGHFWTADQAQIYRTLSALVADGLVKVETQTQETRPNRQVHSIAPQGVEELDRWLSQTATLTPTREPFLMRLFFAGRLGPEAVRRLLTARISEAEELIGTLEAIRAEVKGEAQKGLEGRLRFATLENGHAHAVSERDWARDLLKELEGNEHG